jgi:hypothetical protein
MTMNMEGKTKRDRIRNQTIKIELFIITLKEVIELAQLRRCGHVVRIEDGDTSKWPGKLEYMERDPKEDPDRPGKKGYRRF